MSMSTMPLFLPFIGLGFWCFFARLMPSTSRCLSSTRRSTVPRLPLSLPVVTITSSPLRIFCMAFDSYIPDLGELREGLPQASSTRFLQNFGRERYDFHEALVAQFARHRPEYARADRLQFGVEQHRRVGVELDQRAVGAAHALGGAHHHGTVDLALLYAAARSTVLDADFDYVADPGVTPLRATQYLYAHYGARAGVVGDIQYTLHLNHDFVSSPTWTACGSPFGVPGASRPVLEPVWVVR